MIPENSKTVPRREKNLKSNKIYFWFPGNYLKNSLANLFRPYTFQLVKGDSRRDSQTKTK